MLRASLLASSLLILLISSLTLAGEPTTPNDLFRKIAKHAQRAPAPPMCCLKPLPSSEPAEGIEIMSFEDWKARQALVHANGPRDSAGTGAASAAKASTRDGHGELQKMSVRSGSGPSSSAAHGSPVAPDVHSGRNSSSMPDGAVGGNENGSRAGDGVAPTAGTYSPVSSPSTPPTPTPPHFRIPITDRFNYASVDCSARVHTAHRSTKSPSAILSAAKDRYMLTPCSTPGEDKFVVVELCEDIRIDTVQLANFEFFSGVFREFNVSVARTYMTDSEGWTFAGTYHAKNIRGIQSFHPPTSLRDFYRFIRIDFISYFGNEYYCPVSLLRIYGLTHLEQWKWEEWEAEAQKKIMSEAEDVIRSVSFQTYEFTQGSRETAHETRDNTTENEAAQVQQSSTRATQYATTSRSSVESPAPPQGAIEAQKVSVNIHNGDPPSNTLVPLSSALSASNTSAYSGPSQGFSTHISDNPGSTIPNSALPVHSSFSSGSSDSRTASSSYSQPNTKPMTSYHSGSSAPVIPTVVPHEAHSSHSISVASTGESIYRQIMTRLSILETNSTLHLRYVEEQARSMRDVLRRLEEDIGRLEGIGKAQAQFIQRTTQEWERQRRRLEREHGELLTRVNVLADEVVLEKRLGIAQLSLLLVVLIFMALTRGSRGEATAVVSGHHSLLREWGSRQLKSFGSGDWTSRLRGLSLTPTPMSRKRPGDDLDLTAASKFPTNETHDDGKRTPRRRGSLIYSSSSMPRSYMSIRAPHPRHITSTSGFAFGIPPSHSERPRPHLRRSNSHTSTTGGEMVFSHSLSGTLSPLSVKRWAKSAHLHEIRRGRNGQRAGVGAGAGSKVYNKERGRENMPVLVHADLGDVGTGGTVATPSKDRRHKFLLSIPPGSVDHSSGYSHARGREGGAVDFKDNDISDKVLQMSSLQNRFHRNAQSLQVDSKDEEVKVKEERHDVVPSRETWLLDDMKDTKYDNYNDIDAESENWVDTDIESSDSGPGVL